MQDTIDRLSRLSGLVGVPRAELEWLAAHGELRTHDDGDVVVGKEKPVRELMALFTGGFDIRFGHGTGRMHKIEPRAGELTGVLPFSRMLTAAGNVVAVGRTEVLAIDRDHFPELIRECPAVTTALVHAMVDRARVSAATNWQDEKMTSLGRLAAGFAHHLNNPASAAVRSAKQVGASLTELGEAAHTLGRLKLAEAQHARITDLLHICLQAPSRRSDSAIERADREEQIGDWLSSRNVDTSVAASLADSGVSLDVLDALAKELPGDALDPALRWIAAAQTAQSLLNEVCDASSRVHSLVGALTRFTDMDRAAEAHPLDVGQGLADTVVVQGGRAALKSVAVHLDVAPDVPMITAHAADLNQVWSNLLENAIDAANSRVDVSVSATTEPNEVVVRIVDDGPGITADVQARMYDPFYTTKSEGHGIGFGLDIVRRIVFMHEGVVEVDTVPGRTEFRVRIPVR